MSPSGSSPPAAAPPRTSSIALPRTLSASPPPMDQGDKQHRGEGDVRGRDKGKSKAVDNVNEAMPAATSSRSPSRGSGHLAPTRGRLSPHSNTPSDTGPRGSTSSASTGAGVRTGGSASASATAGATSEMAAATTSTSRKKPSDSRHTSSKSSEAGSRNASRNGSRSSLGGAGPKSPQSKSKSPTSPSPRSRSPSPSPRRPTAPTTARPTDNERKQIANQITKKRSRKLLHRRPATPEGGASDSDRDADTWTHEDIAHAQQADREVCMALRSKHVELVVGGRTVHTEAELGDATVPGRTYVWEVMYENQRGTTLFGKSWYSSNTLLPTDPTPFTLPSTLPETEVTAVAPPPGNNQVKRAKPKKVRSSIDTAYTLETYETPSPAWVWLTPWMVNMRSKTDEQGWEYNLWFHSKSWRPCPGHLNWFGWVRRRQWVRLRGLVPEIIEKANEEAREAADDFWGRGKHQHSSDTSSPSSRRQSIEQLAQKPSPGPEGESVPAEQRWDEGDDANVYRVRDIRADDNGENDVQSDRTSTSANASEPSCDSHRVLDLGHFLDSQHPILEMVRALAQSPLDRLKLETLLKWIDDGKPAEVNELKRLLEDSGNLEALGRAFVFPAPRNGMFTAFTQRGIIPKRVCNSCLFLTSLE